MLRKSMLIAIGAGLVLSLLLVATPQVRASLSAWLGLSVASSTEKYAGAVTLVSAKPTTAPESSPNPTSQASHTAPPSQVAWAAPTQQGEIGQISRQAGWNILTPGSLPDKYQFQSAYYDPNHSMAILTYIVTRPLPDTTDSSLTSSRAITLLEALKNDFIPMQVGPGASVEDIQVNGKPGAFVTGAWDTQFVKDEKDPNGGKMVSTWRNDLLVKNIFWQDGKIYLVMISDDPGVSKQDLIDMASSIHGSN